MSPSPAPPSKKAREYLERKFVKKCFKQDRIGRNAERFKLVSVFLFSRRSKYSSLYLLCHIWLNLSVAYILKAGFRGFRNPQIILNFPQRDCSWFQIFWHFAFLWCIVFHWRRIPWIPESADNFEFSAERLSENTKTIKTTLFSELFPLIMFSHYLSE